MKKSVLKRPFTSMMACISSGFRDSGFGITSLLSKDENMKCDYQSGNLGAAFLDRFIGIFDGNPTKPDPGCIADANLALICGFYEFDLPQVVPDSNIQSMTAYAKVAYAHADEWLRNAICEYKENGHFKSISGQPIFPDPNQPYDSDRCRPMGTYLAEIMKVAYAGIIKQLAKARISDQTSVMNTCPCFYFFTPLEFAIKVASIAEFEMAKAQHMVVGGDFNLDMDTSIMSISTESCDKDGHHELIWYQTSIK